MKGICRLRTSHFGGGVQDMRSWDGGDLSGRFLATTRQRLGEAAERLGLKRVPNVGGRPAS
jgi:hypothetical protein